MNTKILASALLAFSFAALANPTFKSVEYHDRLSGTFREEYVRAWPKCQSVTKARKVYFVKGNELREVAYWNEKGKIHEAGKSNNPDVHKKVNEIFAGAQIESTNPCITPKPTDTSSDAVAQ